MIKFFRKIRQSLFERGNFRKYSLYATGEIMLVVIGILIALQINNWNEARKENEAIKSVLLNLKTDIDNDIRFYMKLDSVYRYYYSEAIRLETELHNSSHSKIDSSKDWYIGRGSMYYLSVFTSAFDQMKNTGLLYSISDSDITNSINDYYSFAEVEMEKANIDNHDYHNFALNNSGYEYISVAARLRNGVNKEFLDWSWLMDPGSEQYKFYEARIGYHKVAIEANQKLINELLEKAEDVLKALGH